VYCLTPLRTWNHLVPSRDNTLLFSSLQMPDRPPIIANLHFHPCCLCMSCNNLCPACLATTHELCIKNTCRVLTSSLVPSILDCYEVHPLDLFVVPTAFKPCNRTVRVPCRMPHWHQQSR
jgi:hypothetical protein